MKKIIPLMVLVISLGQVMQAQEKIVALDFSTAGTTTSIPTFSKSIFLQDTVHTSAYYLQRGKNQETVAWVMLGGGLIMSTIGVVGAATNALNPDNSGETYAIVALTGIGLALGSIPIFITSGHTARKAATLSLRNQPIGLPRQNNYALTSQPGISIHIPL
jgi:hypothetical protein